ncbi:hypothetical protein EDD11_002544 [Mortierella claussenii]|nr:hypothetical protein EDD11_002544 [Mortierella claussenii]
MIIVMALALIFTASLLNTVLAISYQRVSYPATAMLGSRLYIYGGITESSSSLLTSTAYSSQFATLSLTNGFDTDDNLPWEFLPGYMATAMAPGSPSRDQRRFIVGGSRNNQGNAPALVFDSTTRIWSQTGDLPAVGGVGVMQGYRRDSPDMAMDLTTGMLVQFGGSNATHAATNALTVLDTNKASNMMSWSYSGYLDTVPALFAPIVLYLPTIKATLIMGGCDQLDNSSVPVHCATFDTLYTLSSDSIVSTAGPKATVVKAKSGTELEMDLPNARVMPCAVVMPDGNVMIMGGGTPGTTSGAMADTWILNTRTWTWAPREIEDFPKNGIMGHSCQIASHDQMLVIGGHANGEFMPNPISVIKMRKWAWSGHYFVPGFSTGVKVGLALSVVVVLGAIIAGLWIRWRRSKMAALSKAPDHHGENNNIKMRHGSRNNNRPGAGSHRRKRQAQQRTLNPEGETAALAGGHELIALEGVQVHSEVMDQHHRDGDVPQLNFTLAQEGPYEHVEDCRQHGHRELELEQQHQQLAIDSIAHSPIGSSSSTIVGPSSPSSEMNEHDQAALWSESRSIQGNGIRQDQAECNTSSSSAEHDARTKERPDLKKETP